MKKCVLVVLIFVYLVPAFAQKGLHFGVSGTFNSTWILKQNDYGTLAPFQDPVVKSSQLAYKYTWGWNAGAQVGYNFTKHWGVEIEAQYNYTGQSYDDNFSGPATIPEGTFGSASSYVNVKRDIRLTYLQFPIMGKYMVGNKHVKFFAALGPQVGIRTSAKEEVKIAGYVYLPDSLAFKPSEKFQTLDLGVTAQAGVQIFLVQNFYLETGLTSYLGILDINGDALKKLGWYSKNDVSYKKSYNFRAGLTVGVHYLLPFKQKVYLPND